MSKIVMVATTLLSMAACATPQTASDPVGEATCKDEALRSFIGVRASQSSGTEMLKSSGARYLRWVGPGMAVTMDYQPDRLTISYNQAMAITSARCG